MQAKWLQGNQGCFHSLHLPRPPHCCQGPRPTRLWILWQAPPPLTYPQIPDSPVTPEGWFEQLCRPDTVHKSSKIISFWPSTRFCWLHMYNSKAFSLSKYALRSVLQVFKLQSRSSGKNQMFPLRWFNCVMRSLVQRFIEHHNSTFL